MTRFRMTLFVGLLVLFLSTPAYQKPMLINSMTSDQKSPINNFLNDINPINVPNPRIDRPFTTKDINVPGNADTRRIQNSRRLLGIFSFTSTAEKNSTVP